MSEPVDRDVPAPEEAPEPEAPAEAPVALSSDAIIEATTPMRAPSIPPPLPAPPAQPVPVAYPAQPGMPYRVPEVPGAPMMPEAFPGFAPPRRPWPIVGPAFSVFGILLWSFVIGGQLTTSWMGGAPLPQPAAFLFVFASTFAMWIVGIRRSRLAMPPRSGAHLFGRAVGMGMLGFALFLACIFASVIAGEIGRGRHDFAIAFGLVLVAAFAGIAGPRWTWPSRPDPTEGQRKAWALLWLGGTVLTIVAGIELLTNG